ncbi:MAG: response regulator [Xanthomonadales bacterium]|nr:response regulator [Xanthomonadales bacterium]
MSALTVALCGMTPRDSRLLEIVVTRAPNRKFDFRLVNADQVSRADIAIIDADRSDHADQAKRLRDGSPDVVEVYVSDSGAAGQGSYRIARRTLVLQCFRLLESIAATRRGRDASVERAPARQAAAESAAVSSLPQVGNATAQDKPAALTLTALVVDDSATVRTQLEVTLRRMGLNVETAADGHRALTLLQSRSYDLVVVDVVMPGPNGYEVCREIRGMRSGRHVPVAILSSRNSPFDRARGALAGCDVYLSKPVAVRDFHAAMHKAMIKRFTVDELAARGYRRPVPQQKAG